MKENYSLCLINDNRVTLVNDDTSTSWSVINDKVLLDVKVLIDEHNNLVIEGEPLVYEFASLPVDIEELDHKPCNKYIKEYKPGKIAKFFGSKPFKYVEGWWAYRQKTPIKYILNNYRIKLI